MPHFPDVPVSEGARFINSSSWTIEINFLVYFKHLFGFHLKIKNKTQLIMHKQV